MKAKPSLAHKRNQSELNVKLDTLSFELPQIKANVSGQLNPILGSKNHTPNEKNPKNNPLNSSASVSKIMTSQILKKFKPSINNTFHSPRTDVVKKTLANLQNFPTTLLTQKSTDVSDSKRQIPSNIDSQNSFQMKESSSQNVLKTQSSRLKIDTRRVSKGQSQPSSPIKTAYQSPEHSPMKFGKPKPKNGTFLNGSKPDLEETGLQKSHRMTGSKSTTNLIKYSPNKNSTLNELDINIIQQMEKENNQPFYSAKGDLQSSISKDQSSSIEEYKSKIEEAPLAEIKQSNVFRKAKTFDEIGFVKTRTFKRSLNKQPSINFQEKAQELFTYKASKLEIEEPNFSFTKVNHSESTKDIRKDSDLKNIPFFIKESVSTRSKSKQTLPKKLPLEYQSPTSFFSNINNTKKDIFIGDGVKFFEIDENSKLAAEAQTPRALRVARQRQNLEKPFGFSKNDYGPVILSYYDIFDTRVVQPKFMEEMGSMCTSELWPNQCKKEYFYRMKDHAVIKKTYNDVHGLYRPEKSNKRFETHSDEKLK